MDSLFENPSICPDQYMLCRASETLSTTVADPPFILLTLARSTNSCFALTHFSLSGRRSFPRFQYPMIQTGISPMLSALPLGRCKYRTAMLSEVVKEFAAYSYSISTKLSGGAKRARTSSAVTFCGTPATGYSPPRQLSRPQAMAGEARRKQSPRAKDLEMGEDWIPNRGVLQVWSGRAYLSKS